MQEEFRISLDYLVPVLHKLSELLPVPTKRSSLFQKRNIVDILRDYLGNSLLVDVYFDEVTHPDFPDVLLHYLFVVDYKEVVGLLHYYQRKILTEKQAERMVKLIDTTEVQYFLYQLREQNVPRLGAKEQIIREKLGSGKVAKTLLEKAQKELFRPLDNNTIATIVSTFITKKYISASQKANLEMLLSNAVLQEPLVLKLHKNRWIDFAYRIRSADFDTKSAFGTKLSKAKTKVGIGKQNGFLKLSETIRVLTDADKVPAAQNRILLAEFPEDG